MAENVRFSGYNDWLELEFVDRDQTSTELVQFCILFNIYEVPLLYNIVELVNFGSQRSEKSIHD
jgi:hypothetical protein